MDREFKTLRTATKSIDGRTVVGIVAVHGNIDDGGDRSWPGSFGDLTVDGRMRARFLWMHNAMDPPTASINYVREIPKAQLPDRVRSYAPDATGGVEVSRTYLDTPRANEVLAGITAGAIDEMSYAYQATRYDFEEIEGKTIRNLYAMEIYDLSDVTWGMNPATAASKAGWEAAPLVTHADSLEGEVQAFLDRVATLKTRRTKEGRVFSQANARRIGTIAEQLASAATDLSAMLADSDPAGDRAKAVRTLYLDSQRILAQLNGVTL
jgi:Caudovirus prohead serine protease